MEQYTLKAAFLAMVYTAEKEGVELDQKFLDMRDSILANDDIDVTNMVDNMENVFNLIEQE